MHENRETSGAVLVATMDRDRSGKAISRTADMHASEESDCAIVPMNQPNKDGQSSRRRLGREGRGPRRTSFNPHTRPTQSGERVSQGLSGVREAAKERKQERFTALLHHLTVDLLRDSFYALEAAGCAGSGWRDVAGV